MLIGLSILFVSGVAVLANRVSGEEVVSGTDPNVEALKAVRKEPPCYLQDDKSCKNPSNKSMCAACDDEIIVKPDKKE